jgi:hypothetical protein
VVYQIGIIIFVLGAIEEVNHQFCQIIKLIILSDQINKDVPAKSRYNDNWILRECRNEKKPQYCQY